MARKAAEQAAAKAAKEQEQRGRRITGNTQAKGAKAEAEAAAKSFGAAPIPVYKKEVTAAKAAAQAWLLHGVRRAVLGPQRALRPWDGRC